MNNTTTSFPMIYTRESEAGWYWKKWGRKGMEAHVKGGGEWRKRDMVTNKTAFDTTRRRRRRGTTTTTTLSPCSKTCSVFLARSHFHPTAGPPRGTLFQVKSPSPAFPSPMTRDHFIIPNCLLSLSCSFNLISSGCCSRSTEREHLKWLMTRHT